MQWWGWALCWIGLIALAGGYLAWRLWRLWPHLRSFGAEVATAEDLLDQLDRRSDAASSTMSTSAMHSVDELAVLQSPLALNTQRLNIQQTQRQARAERRVARTRRWIDDVE